MGQLRERLQLARHQRFVGRAAELALFRHALDHPPADFAVLHIYGPGGVGKTTLLHEYARLAQAAQRTLVFLDGRNLDASPAGFLQALQSALSLPAVTALPATLAAAQDLVLLLDTYELIMPLDSWLRDEFLPQLPQQALVVLAGRQPPATAWRADNGWGPLTRVLALRNLQPDECKVYLDARAIAPDKAERVLRVTHGHPLALSLAADILSQNEQAAPFHFRQAPDLMGELLARFVADVPNASLRQALEVCAHALTTDEGLLAHCLGPERAYAAFAWLRSLSFVEQSPNGLFPHDLAREVLEADLRWRNPPRFVELHQQVRNYIIQQITAGGQAQQMAILALLFLHRNNPIMQPFYAWQSFGQAYMDQVDPADIPVIEQLVRQSQGEAALTVTRHWLARQPEHFFVFRGDGRAMTGFAHYVDMSHLTPEDIAVDPAMRAAVGYLASQPSAAAKAANSPVSLPPDTTAVYFRNWMAVEGDQRSTTIFSMCALLSMRCVFSTPNLAYIFVAQAYTEHYLPMFDFIRWPLTPEAFFTLGERTYGVFAHDWLVEPVMPWLDAMAEVELMDESGMPVPLVQVQQPLALSKTEFGEAVRDALKVLHRPDLLAENPLLHARFIHDSQSDAPAVEQLQQWLHRAAESLTTTPKDQKLHRALWHTYFEPALTQEAAAELLDLPFSTYRYHLGKAIDRVVIYLWQHEADDVV